MSGPLPLDSYASLYIQKSKVCHPVPCRPEVPTNLGVYVTPHHNRTKDNLLGASGPRWRRWQDPPPHWKLELAEQLGLLEF